MEHFWEDEISPVVQRMALIKGNATVSTSYVKLNNAGDPMYKKGTEFEFSPGDSLYICAIGTMGGGSISINGEQVASSAQDAATYNYTLPDENIKIDIQVSSTATITITEGSPEPN